MQSELANFLKNNKNLWYTTKRLARIFETRVSTVSRGLRGLIKLGYVRQEWLVHDKHKPKRIYKIKLLKEYLDECKNGDVSEED